MNEGTLYKFRGRLRTPSGKEDTPTCTCYACCGLGRTPYRYRTTQTVNGYIYLLLPCYACDAVKYRIEKAKYPSLEAVERWVNMSVEAQCNAMTTSVPVTLDELLEDSDEPG